MNGKGMSVKVTDVSGSYVSLRYLSSNAKTRMKKEDFMRDFQTGIFNVKNPEILEGLEEEKSE